jgi:outer membrane receptor protein involved in Fe transport
LKLQGEYFRRSESGQFAGLDYDGDQSGWYAQALWQFAPRWRIGMRLDSVDADSNALMLGTALEDPDRNSSRSSVMVDWSPSEYSRLRAQYINDRVLADTDQQFLLQYIMSIGAHGAHEF